MLRSRGMIGSVFSLADKAAQIAVEIPRQLSSRLFLGACLPFPRLHTPKRAFLYLFSPFTRGYRESYQGALCADHRALFSSYIHSTVH